MKEFHIFIFQNRLLVQKKFHLGYMGKQVVNSTENNDKQ